MAQNRAGLEPVKREWSARLPPGVIRYRHDEPGRSPALRFMNVKK